MDIHDNLGHQHADRGPRVIRTERENRFDEDLSYVRATPRSNAAGTSESMVMSTIDTFSQDHTYTTIHLQLLTHSVKIRTLTFEISTILWKNTESQLLTHPKFR
jgi:hypothetical protein